MALKQAGAVPPLCLRGELIWQLIGEQLMIVSASIQPWLEKGTIFEAICGKLAVGIQLPTYPFF